MVSLDQRLRGCDEMAVKSRGSPTGYSIDVTGQYAWRSRDGCLEDVRGMLPCIWEFGWRRFAVDATPRHVDGVVSHSLLEVSASVLTNDCAMHLMDRAVPVLCPYGFLRSF